jgi:hypothetical protein
LIYVGISLGWVYRFVKSGGVWNATWISAHFPANFIWDITPLPPDLNTIIVVMSAFGTCHVWRGLVPSEGGATWTDISAGLPDIPVNALAIEPSSPNTMYVGEDIDVFTTTDGGATWTNFSQGLPNVAIFDMRLHASSRLLHVATPGLGMWERKLETTVRSDIIYLYETISWIQEGSVHLHNPFL